MKKKQYGKVVTDIKKVLPEAIIYVFDNNSSDDTVKIAQNAGAVIKYEYKQGKGNVIRRMFREIDAECYIILDGDDTYPAEYSREMCDLVLKKGIDMVVGDRLSSTYFSENKRKFHNFGNSIVKNSINYIFKSNIKDIMTGYRAFSYQFVKTFPVISEGFEIETEMTIHAIDKNMLIKNVIVPYRGRMKGSKSKLKTFSDGFKVLKTIGRLFRDYKPLKFFGLISFILFLFSIVFFIPILIEYIYTGLVPRLPTLLVCAFLGLASLLSLFSGMILESLKLKNKQDFEMNLINVYERYKDI